MTNLPLKASCGIILHTLFLTLSVKLCKDGYFVDIFYEGFLSSPIVVLNSFISKYVLISTYFTSSNQVFTKNYLHYLQRFR